jgi:predicted Zn-dependent peptidase
MPADRSRLPDVGPDPRFPFPRILRSTLPNGLQVRTVEHHTVPVVSCVLQIPGGAGADAAGQEGLAALTADMIDEGTGRLSAIDVSEAIASIGGEYDVDVGADATSIGLTTLSRFAGRGMSLLADLVVRPSLREEDFDRVRQMRLNRLRQLKDLPPAVAERTFLRLLYDRHPYGHLPIGTEPALAAFGPGDVAALHARRFRPDTATLVVVGPMTHEDLLAVVESAFSDWERVEQEKTLYGGDIEPAIAPQTLAIVPRPGAAQSELRIGHLSARRSTPDYPALLVMNAVLGGQFVSRINLRLREEKGFTYGARTGFDWKRGLAPFALQASVHTAATAEAVADSLREIEAIRGDRPPSQEEMILARASLTRGYARNFETAPQIARSVAQLALYDLPDTYFEEFVPRIQAVTAEDVLRAAAQYVDTSRAITLVVGDFVAVGESLRALGLGDPTVLPTNPES